jgi:hypothetical protein
MVVVEVLVREAVLTTDSVLSAVRFPPPVRPFPVNMDLEDRARVLALSFAILAALAVAACAVDVDETVSFSWTTPAPDVDATGRPANELPVIVAALMFVSVSAAPSVNLNPPDLARI